MKVIILGDSTGMPRIYGKTSPKHPEIEVHYDECFPELLRRMMKEEFSEDVVVRDLCARYYLSKNLCGQGYGEAHLFEPDYIIVAVGMVDCWSRTGINWAPDPELAGKSPWINRSEFDVYIRRFVEQCFKTIKNLKGIFFRGIINCSRNQYDKHVGCEQKSIDYNLVMQDVAKIHNVYYVDVFNHPIEDHLLLTSDGAHPSARGHRFTAEKLFHLMMNIHKSNVGTLSLKKALNNFECWQKNQLPKKGQITSTNKFDAETIKAISQNKCNKLLITGERCSGTTLLTNLLNNQNNITICRDYLHLHRLMQPLGISSIKANLSKEQNVVLKKHFTAWNNLRGGIEVVFPDSGFKNLLFFYNYALSAISQPTDILFGHKSTMAHGIIDQLLSTTTDLKILYIIRDPRNVVASAYSTWPTGQETIFDFAEQWRAAATTIMQYQKGKTHINKLMLVYFEKLMADPEIILAKIADFLKVDQIKLPDSYISMEAMWHDNTLAKNTVESFKSNNNGLWQYSNPLISKVIQTMLHREMRQLGYETSEKISDQEISLVKALQASMTFHRDMSQRKH